MASVYSTLLISQQGVSGSLSYDVPTGYVLVVRDVDIYIHGDLISTTYYVTDNESDATFAWSASPEAGDPGLYSWRGRKVVNAGSGITVSGGGTYDVNISGYLLGP